MIQHITCTSIFITLIFFALFWLSRSIDMTYFIFSTDGLWLLLSNSRFISWPSTALNSQSCLLVTFPRKMYFYSHTISVQRNFCIYCFKSPNFIISCVGQETSEANSTTTTIFATTTNAVFTTIGPFYHSHFLLCVLPF